MVSALVLLLCPEDVWGLGRRWEEVDWILPEPVGIELVPGVLGLIFLPEARPKDLFALFCPEMVLCPALDSRSGGEVALPRLLNAARSRSLPLPYFNKAKTIVVVSIP